MPSPQTSSSFKWKWDDIRNIFSSLSNPTTSYTMIDQHPPTDVNGQVEDDASGNIQANKLADEVQRDIALGGISETAVIVEGEERTTRFVWLLAFACSISGLLFGYDTGVISGALVTIGDDLGAPGSELSSLQKELITSATTLGALIGSLISGILSDYSGRKPVISLADLIFIFGAIAQSLSHTVRAMIAGRFLIGLGVGLASCIAPLYIQELSPTRLRGRMVVLTVVAITGGQVVAYGIGAAFENMRGGWRWMVGLGAVPAALQLVFLVFLPESPRILIRKGRMDRARGVLGRIYAHASEEQVVMKVEVLRAAVLQSVRISEGTTLVQRIRSMFIEPVNRRALIIACGLQAFQQLSGFNTLMYYSATLFKSIGFNQPTAVGLIIAGTNFLFTLVALKYIDMIGRRRIMLYSSPGMVLGLTLAAISFHFLTKDTGGVLVDGAQYSTKWSALVLVSMIIYVASYATGVGNVPWQQGELFALEVRGIGTSLSTTTNWACNLLIGSTYLSLMAAITPSGAFGLYGGLCFLGFAFCLACYPETAGLSLEEVTNVFQNGFGVKESERMRSEKRMLQRRVVRRGEEESGSSSSTVS
ncbi:general substrate transporter [Sistotremastrum niveocremeum HHB9708]|uniref:General substrate transporter n=1 Tax=Sistotremastrum niveocremeum HHB9708 TaxID=1314777 RepID=A0A164ML22_9AGAM|nr:general substrate transporter [Sistotremastrum niveocremeum HHB9708]